jgi:hypothetical protein
MRSGGLESCCSLLILAKIRRSVTSDRHDDSQHDRPQSHIKLRRTAELRVKQLRPPTLGRLVAVIDAEAYEHARGSQAGVAKHPLPYWLAVVHGADVTDEQWLGAESFEVRYLEDPTPVYCDGQLHHWDYMSDGTDACFVSREHVLCQLPVFFLCADDYDFVGFLRQLQVPEVRAVHTLRVR